MRAREAASCSRASALASASVISSAKPEIRSSASSGSPNGRAGRGDHRAPQAAGDDDRRADRGADADRAQAHREVVLELVVRVDAHGPAAAQDARRDRLAVHREVRGDRERGRAARRPRSRGPSPRRPCS